MRKLLLILSVLFVVSCSSGSEDEEDKIPKEIKLTLEQDWVDQARWNDFNSTIGQCNRDGKAYMYTPGFSGYPKYHYGYDTLHIDFRGKMSSAKGVDFNQKDIRGFEGTSYLPHPNFIKYIFIDNFDNQILMFKKNYKQNEIQYWESNVSEETLNSLLTGTSESTIGCPNNNQTISFKKITSNISLIKNSSKNLIYNETNDKIKVGDKLEDGDNDEEYFVIKKEYIF